MTESKQYLFDLRNIESIIFSEAFVKEASKQHIETLSCTDLLQTDNTFQRSIIDSLALTVNSSIISFKTISDLLAISEIIKKSINIPKNEILVISEEDIKNLGKNVLENLTIEELRQSESTYFIDLLDEASLLENIVKSQNINFSDILTISDALSKLKTSPLDTTPILMTTRQGKTILLTQ